MPRDLVLTPHIDDQQAAQITRMAKQLDWQLDHPTGVPQSITQSGLLEQLGIFLWEAARLEADTIRAALEVAQESEQSLRILVQGERGQHLPWELLYDPHPELGFMARHSWCIVSRRIRGTGEHQPRLMPRPLRPLLFIASPEDLDPERSRLDFEREEELLYTALDRPLARGEVEIDVAEDGVFATLLTRLEEQRYHAVILSMHGAPSRNSQGREAWGLLFEDARTGRSAPTAGSDLATQLDRLPRGHRPGLVILAACRSTRADESAESLSSVAATLHTLGVERVLGMRLSVLDGAASAFDAELFRRLALGDDVGRAVTLARQAVVQDSWWQPLHGQDWSRGDPWAQWSLPVLLDRTQDGPLVDTDSSAIVLSPRSNPTLLIGDGTVHLPDRQAFIGRRKEKRQYLRPFLEGETRGLLSTGPGGVGKTTLAGLFARAFGEHSPNARLLGFRAPFVLDMLYEPLRREAFDGMEEPSLLPAIQLVLGGNHRAIEWAVQVLKQEHQGTIELVAALSRLHAPPDTPEQGRR